MIDMRKTIEPKSDQLNYDDFIAGSTKTITITDIKASKSADQPISVYYEGDKGKPYKPCKSMRRVMVNCWGADGKTYIGKSMTLYGDPKVKWAGQEVGGIRISHMSHIDKPKTIQLTTTRGVRGVFNIKPLVNIPVDVSDKELDDEIDGGDDGFDEPELYESLRDRAEAASEKGMGAYTDFWKTLTKNDKSRLTDEGDHAKFKTNAASKDEPEF